MVAVEIVQDVTAYGGLQTFSYAEFREEICAEALSVKHTGRSAVGYAPVCHVEARDVV